MNKERIARPLGLTLMAQQYHKTEGTKAQSQQKHEMQEYVIRLYLQQGFRINNREYSIEQLAQYTNLTKKEVLYKLSHYKGDYISVDNQEDLNKAASLALMNLFEKTFEVQNKVNGNLENLLSAYRGVVEKVREGKYYDRRLEKRLGKSPQAALIMAQREEFEGMAIQGYVKGLQPDVNAALNLSLQGQKGMERLVRLMAELGGKLKNGPSTIINANQTNTTTENHNLLTVDKAYIMIAENKEGLLLTENQRANLEDTYLGDVPDVDARTQSGYKAPITRADRSRITSHENRREDSIGEIVE